MAIRDFYLVTPNSYFIMNLSIFDSDWLYRDFLFSIDKSLSMMPTKALKMDDDGSYNWRLFAEDKRILPSYALSGSGSQSVGRCRLFQVIDAVLVPSQYAQQPYQNPVQSYPLFAVLSFE